MNTEKSLGFNIQSPEECRRILSKLGCKHLTEFRSETHLEMTMLLLNTVKTMMYMHTMVLGQQWQMISL